MSIGNAPGGGADAAVGLGTVVLNQLALWSLVLGILGFLCLPAPVAIILGIIALVQISGSEGMQKGTGMAIGGIVAGGVWPVFLLVVLPMLAAIFMPAFATARTRAREAECGAQLRMIAAALKVYQVENGCYPAGQGRDLLGVLEGRYLKAGGPRAPLCCPATGRRYRGPKDPLQTTADADTVIACDEPGNHPGAIMVLTGDGNMRRVPAGDPEYDRVLKATRGD